MGNTTKSHGILQKLLQHSGRYKGVNCLTPVGMYGKINKNVQFGLSGFPRIQEVLFHISGRKSVFFDHDMWPVFKNFSIC